MIWVSTLSNSWGLPEIGFRCDFEAKRLTNEGFWDEDCFKNGFFRTIDNAMPDLLDPEQRWSFRI